MIPSIRPAVLVTLQDVNLQFRGQIVGRAWVFLQPLVVFAVYIFLFVFVMDVRMDPLAGGSGNYGVYLLSGLVPWLAFQTSVVRSTTSIRGHMVLVNQPGFRKLAIPFSDVFMGVPTWVVGMISLLVYASASGAAQLSWFAIPIVVGIQIFLTAGWCMAISAISPFLRDLKDVVAVLLTVAMFTLPIIFQPNSVPAVFQPIIWANPFSYFAFVYQDVLYFGSVTHPAAWIFAPAFAAISYIAGLKLFRRLQPQFGAVL